MSSRSTTGRRQRGLLPALLLAVLPVGVAPETWAADVLHPYEAASTGYFREQDTLPGSYHLYQTEQAGRFWGLGPGGSEVRRASFSSDAHVDVLGYTGRTCVSCHETERHSLHSSRGNVSCVQCHRGEPIAGIHHYYSPMNPIRRHAYVCAKCHQGASASFATYVIHEPPPLADSTRDEFALFHYAVWFMVILAVGIFAIFLPYVALWGMRELGGWARAKKSAGGPHDD